MRTRQSTETSATVQAVAPEASVIVVCWNGREHLDQCLSALLRQRHPSFEVIVVDNASSDGSVDYVRERFQNVRVIETGVNLGYTGGNNVGLRAARGRYVAVLNADTEAAPGWLSALTTALEAHPRDAITTSKVLHFASDRRDRVNACGNDLHIAGFGFCRGLDRPASEFQRDEIVPAISGCAFAAGRELFERIGLFDETLFMSMEDTDLSIRARLAGVDCLLAANSAVYHKYDIRLHPRKFFLLERNRWLVLLKHYRWRTLLAIAPALAVAEALTWGYAAIRGPSYLRAKAQATLELVTRPSLWREGRARAQRLRRVSDRAILASTIAAIPFQQLTENSLFRRGLPLLMNPLYGLSRRLALALVRW